MNFTDEQREAIDLHERNVIVTAGAGSGKTRVLVERFIALLDRHADWSLPSVVAITFTEKAATEMLDRVRQAIEDRVLAALESRDDVQLDRWLAHQAALSRARIGTIHALCASLLRNNPAEAALDPDFDVLDETEAAIVREDAVELALAQLATDDRPGVEVLATFEVNDVRNVLRSALTASASAWLASHLDGDEEMLLARWRAMWKDATRQVMAEAQHNAGIREAVAWVPATGWPVDDRLMANWHVIHAHADALFGDDPEAFSRAINALAGEIDLRGGRDANWGGKEGKKQCSEILKGIREWARDCQKRLLPLPGDADAQIARLLFAWGDAIRCAADAYERLKEARGALDFDDLETRALALLRHHPDVVARYADPVHGEFRHILVDEFQDTNEAQRAIIYALSGLEREGAAGRLFVVGDPKQSIYGFRGADVTVFDRVRDDFRSRGGKELRLTCSFRSHDRLVRAFNALFARILQRGTGPAARYETPLDHPLEAHRPSEQWHMAPLTVIALQRPDKDAFPKFGATEFRQWEAAEIARKLHHMVDNETPIYDREQEAYRPMDYGDVAVLFQSMTEVVAYEAVFKMLELPYVTIAGRGYFDRQEVWDLLALLRALHSPADDLSLATALRSPLFGISDEALFACRLVEDEAGVPLPLWAALFDYAGTLPISEQDADACEFARQTLAALHDLAGRATIAEVLLRALDLTGYMATLTGLADGARRRGNVEKLVSLARASGRIGLGEFLAYAHDLTAREVREGEAAVDVEGVVKLMTVHASKGLEFPVVVLARANWSRSVRSTGVFALDRDIGPVGRLPSPDPDNKPDDPFAWTYMQMLDAQRDHAERRRLLYVGATRAADYLIVSGQLYRCHERAWLRQWLDALDVEEDALEPAPEPRILSYAWGACELFVPQDVFLPERMPEDGAGARAGWQLPEVLARVPVPGVEAALPPLTQDVPFDPVVPSTELSASSLIKLGHVPYYDPTALGRAAFRHAVLYDAPQPVRPLPPRQLERWRLRRAVGEIVHRALRAWALPDRVPAADLRARLRVYAWETQLTAEQQVDRALEQALALLERFAASDMRQWLDRAGEIYYEIPFIHRERGRTVHGVIDVLFRDEGGWHVLDYKTPPVSWDDVPDHARRYYYQVGAYARAVRARTGEQPRVWLYYIHPARLFEVHPDDWEPVYRRLDDDVRHALQPDGV